MILLWGLPEDEPLLAVADALDRIGGQFALLDQRASSATTLCLEVDAEVRGEVRVAEESLALSSVKAAYIRPYDMHRLPEIEAAGPGSVPWQHARTLEDLLLSWAEMTPALVINRPSAMAGNTSKPWQLEQIRAHGLAMPETLLTTDPDVVRAFWQLHGEVIYKSISGIRSRVSRLGPQHVERLGDVVWCPTQLQRYIAGTDVRVHIIGQEVFACEVVSKADDYRFADDFHGKPAIRTYHVPDALADRCRTMAAAMRLHVAGVDLRRTAEGEWYCFEVNPSPAFIYYEAETRQPISEAIARLLVDADQAPA